MYVEGERGGGVYFVLSECMGSLQVGQHYLTGRRAH